MKKCCKLEQPVASGEQTAKFHLWFDPKCLGLLLGLFSARLPAALIKY